MKRRSSFFLYLFHSRAFFCLDRKHSQISAFFLLAMPLPCFAMDDDMNQGIEFASFVSKALVGY